MRLSVRYMAQLKHAAGVGSEQVELDGACTVAGLVAHLAGRNGNLCRLLLDERGGPQPTILVFLGDEQAGPATPLREGAVVTLLSPMAGG
jgi:molybdopterin converting factor small subunit